MNIKQILVAFLFTALVISCGNKAKDTNVSEIKKESTSDCNGYGDKSFIESKMKQMDRDIIEFSEIGKRKYYIRYISWRTGSAVNGDQILDYKNSPCRD